MSRIVELLSRRVPQVAALTLMSIGFAGCSADMSTRLSQNPFSNPFASQPEATGSVPTPTVERRELPQYSRALSLSESSALPPPAVSAPQSNLAAGRGVSAGRGLASYRAPAHPLENTSTVGPRSVAATRGSAQGGTTIIVGTSDTVEILSRRYNVSPAAILQANGYKGPRVLSPGQQLIIPRQTAAVAAPASKAAAPASAAPSVHIVNRGDSLLSIARRNHVSVAELARANSLNPSAKLKLGMKLTVPGAKTAAVAPDRSPSQACAVARSERASRRGPAKSCASQRATASPSHRRAVAASPSSSEPRPRR